MIAAATTTVAWIVLAVILIGWLLYAFLNIRSSRAELGSEIELAANRKPYYDDEILEGRRLTLFQLIAVILLAIIVIALPLYWVLEPDRRPAPPRARPTVSSPGFTPVRPHRRQRLQLRRLPRRHERDRRRGALHRHRSGDRRRALGRVDGAGAGHRAVPLRPREIRYILTYGRPARRCRHGASTVAAR